MEGREKLSDLLTGPLRDVSRSFYLTLRLLPRRVRRPIGLAYLLARASDTLADTAGVPVADRLRGLRSLSAAVEDPEARAPDLSPFAVSDASPGERALLARFGDCLQALAEMDDFEKRLVREVVGVIFGGQALDLERFGAPENAGVVAALPDAAALDDYTYRVAGCVGEFWTRLCRGRLFPGAWIDDAAFLEDGIRFGKGLQLVNILRDLPCDLRSGRCYLPADELVAVGLTPESLRDPSNEPRLRPVYDRWIGIARGHLAAGWRYTSTIPRGEARLRVACALPVLIGVRTLGLLRQGPVLDPGRRIKVGRTEIRRILWSATWRLLPGAGWKRLHAIHTAAAGMRAGPA